MKGILFTQDNLKATIEVRKTQTRRLSGLYDVNMVGLDGANNPTNPSQYEYLGMNNGIADFNRFAINIGGINVGVIYHCKPRYQVGEVVYIKEAWRVYDVDTRSLNDKEFHVKVEYKDNFTKWGYIPRTTSFTIPDKWHSPMMLPAKAARYFITIEDVGAERLQEINKTYHDEILKEGYPFDCDVTILRENPVTTFARLWDLINKPPYDWASNPWVFVYTYSLNKGE